MIVFPNCKINLGLSILRKRSNGFHDLETVFYPLPLTDILEIIENRHPELSRDMPFTISGFSMPDAPGSNLCANAYKLLKKDFPKLPFIQMHLRKTIPLGAGLGGGSADAAFTLKLLNEKFGLHLSDRRLMDYALQLGSDCPFFILNKPCFATGSGELLEEINIDLSAYKFIIVNPGIHIHTGDAFTKIKPATPEKSIKDIIFTPVENWKNKLRNDFEKLVFSQHREIADIKDQLYGGGAAYASMSGSGSTVYGIFPKQKQLNLSFPDHYFVKELTC